MTHYCPRCKTETLERAKTIYKSKWSKVIDVFCLHCGYYHGRFAEQYMFMRRLPGVTKEG